MSQPSGVAPFRVVYSGRCQDSVRNLLARATARGRFAEIAQILRGIHTRLEWIPLDFGEPLCDHVQLGLLELIGVLAPVVVTYAVDQARRIVYVVLPLKLLSRSGL